MRQNRLAWANWADKNSSIAWIAFAWPVGMNPAIQASIQADPSGQGAKDSDVQFVSEFNLAGGNCRFYDASGVNHYG